MADHHLDPATGNYLRFWGQGGWEIPSPEEGRNCVLFVRSVDFNITRVQVLFGKNWITQIIEVIPENISGCSVSHLKLFLIQGADFDLAVDMAKL